MIALVLAIVPGVITWLLAIVIAFVVLVRASDGRPRGQKMAVAAIVVALGWFLISAIAIAGIIAANTDWEALEAAPAETTEDTVDEDEGPVHWSTLQVGECVAEEPSGDEVTYVDLISCDEPHAYEVYATFSLPEGPYPGDQEVQRLSDRGCTSRFTDFVGIGVDESELVYFYLSPSEEGWEDRTVFCMVGADTPTTGSLENANR